MPEQAETVATEEVAETAIPQDGDATPEETPEAEQAKKPTETVDFWKAKAREQEKRAKENLAAAEKLREIEESQKSELQKAIERAEAAEGTLATLQAAQQISDWKSEITKLPKYEGVSPEVLRGTSYEELEEHAAQLKALLPEPRKPGSVPGEGRTVTSGSGDRREKFANIIRNGT